MGRFRTVAYKASENHTKTLWVLKCDIKKFFASIDQKVLVDIVDEYIIDKDIVWLISHIVKSFHSTKEGIGLPLGNLTSQLLVNVYMNEFDQFMKHCIKARYYIRYADDFVVLSKNKKWLEEILPKVEKYLFCKLRLRLHPNKVFIQTLASGMDFLGWVHFYDHRVLRTASKKKMFRIVKEKNGKKEILQSYFGMINHGNAKKLQCKLELYVSHLRTEVIGQENIAVGREVLAGSESIPT